MVKMNLNRLIDCPHMREDNFNKILPYLFFSHNQKIDSLGNITITSLSIFNYQYMILSLLDPEKYSTNRASYHEVRAQKHFNHITELDCFLEELKLIFTCVLLFN
jgi:hypothetical protein